MGKDNRKEERKYKRLQVRFGARKPTHRAIAIQLSSNGAFLQASRPVFKPGSGIVIKFDIPAGTFTVNAIVHHAKSVPPEFIRFSRPGMGVEFVSPPPELQKYLKSL